MKKLIRKLKNKISNSGSGLVLVIVALGFVGILTGALLTAAAYIYKLKLYDYNARSNFYYLEQAMDEIYAGVGSQTMTEMQEAYQETREKIVYYDVDTKSYKDIGNDAANKLFKDSFMNKIANNDFFTPVIKDDGSIDYDTGIYTALESMISNSSVQLDRKKLDVVYLNDNGKNYNKADSTQVLAKIVLKNVTLYREVEINRSNANGQFKGKKGKFKQTIKTDIEISRPDFDVNFNNNNLDIDNLFSFCMLADSGIEINESQGSKLTINGNIYGASDFYNKTYNRYDQTSADKIKENEFTLSRTSKDGTVTETTYKMNKVYNRDYGSDLSTTLRNYNIYNSDPSDPNKYLYNGYSDNSKYSGLFINGTNVSILANYVIIPGSLSVMNAGDLTIYGRDGSSVSESNVWVDEMVLDGYVPKVGETQKNEDGTSTIVYKTNKGANAFLDANLYVKDDTQIESDSAKLKLSGGYYGYSDSNTSDSRVFVPTTKKDSSGNLTNIYEQINSDGKVENRGHYNSSAIVVNSKDATVDLSKLEVLYIAGRSYIELSHQKTGSTVDTLSNDDFIVDDDKNSLYINKSKDTYEYDSEVSDYRTGESVSIKSSQIAYIPDNEPVIRKYKKGTKEDGSYDYIYKGEKYVAVPNFNVSQTDLCFYACSVTNKLKDSYLFKKYFGKGGDASVTEIPVKYYEDEVHKSTGTTKKVMYYIDFDFVSDNELYDSTSDSVLADKATYSGDYADYLEQCFIKDYFDYLDYIDYYNNDQLTKIPGHLDNTDPTNPVYVFDGIDEEIFSDDDLSDLLKEVTQYTDYYAGQISIPDLDSNNVYSYSSGVITNTGEQIFKTKYDTTDNEYKKYNSNSNAYDEKISFNVVTAKDSVIDSTLKGSNTQAFYTTASGKVNNTTDFNKEYQKHYRYVKWALMDLEEGSDEADIVDSINSTNGEGCITPLNRYMNFDNISDDDALMLWPTIPSGGEDLPSTNITPDNLDLGDYKVWVTNDDVSIECEKSDNNTITGIIVSKGDVYFKTFKEIQKDHPTWDDEKCKQAVVNNFNGIIITGGKIYVNNNVTSINSTDLCKNIINSCMTKANLAGTKDVITGGTVVEDNSKLRTEGALAIRVLSLFKSYEAESKAAYDKAYAEYTKINTEGEEEENKDNEDSPLNISNIDYSDVIRYNNWMRNVD